MALQICLRPISAPISLTASAKEMAASIAITGATGFIGSALVAAAAASGARVIALSRQPHAFREPSGHNVTYRVLETPQQLRTVLSDVETVRLVHAASPGIRLEDRSWPALVDGCVKFTLDLVDACGGAKVERFVNVSSWSAYADPPPEDPVLREESPLTQTNLYGAAKAAAELMGSALARQNGLAFCTARLFNVYGPGEANTRLLPQLITRLKRLERAALTPGLQKRDFIFVDDAVNALLRLAMADQVPHSVYNISTGQSVSVREMVERASVVMGAPLELLDFGALPPRPDEPPCVIGDPARFESDFGWRPQTDLQAGLQNYVQKLVTGDPV